jgi:hypothetical protein
MANIYCHGEPGSFPEKEFRSDPNGKIRIPYIHDRGKPHYSSGEPLDPMSDPGIEIARNLAAQLHRLALVMSEKELQDVLDYAKNKHAAR